MSDLAPPTVTTIHGDHSGDTFEHTLRGYTVRDEGFVVVSWVAEAVRGLSLSGIDRSLASAIFRPHIRELLKRRPDLVRIISPRGSMEPIEGFIVSDGPVVYHLHIKGAFRNLGLMTWALGEVGLPRGSRIIAATDTRDLRNIMGKGLYDISLRPELITEFLDGSGRFR